jgi:hypothetical protein
LIYRRNTLSLDTKTIPIRYRLPSSADRKTMFPVQWLVDTKAPKNKRMINLVKRELNFYLVEKEEPDPWAYAKYRCTTASNLYSNVHWSYYPEGDKKGKHSAIIGGSG